MTLAEDTVHFVGGLGDQSGRDALNGGGATRTAYAAGSPSDFMNNDGQPTSNTAAWDTNQTGCTVTDNGGGKIRITKGPLGFIGCVDGTIANVEFIDATYTDGRYEITFVSVSEVDLLAIAYDSNKTCDIKIGGAFDLLQTAIDNDSTNAALYTRTILTNLAESLGVEIDVDTGGGTKSDDTWFRIVGCDEDMIPLASGSYLVIDSTDHVFEQKTFNNFYVENIDMQPGAGKISFLSADPPPSDTYNHVFKNCKFTNGRYSIDQLYSTNIVCIDCVFDTPTSHVFNCTVAAKTLTLINCVIKAAAGQQIFRWVATTTALILVGCDFIDGSFGDIQYGANTTTIFITGCTFYNQTVDVLNLNSANISLVAYNNILMLDDNAAGIRAVEWTAGSVAYMDYNCAYSDSGALDTTPYDNPSAQYHNAHSIEVDPLMVDPANDDFKLEPISPCLNTGIPTVNSGFSSIGAWLRKSFLGID